MKNTFENIGYGLLVITFFAGWIGIVGLGGYIILEWATIPWEQRFETKNLITLALGSLMSLVLYAPISFTRFMCKKRAILKIPEKIPMEEWDEDSMRFILTDLPFNRLRLEVLRNMSDEIFPGWRVYPAREKNAGKCFDIIRKEFENVDVPANMEDLDPFLPLPIIDKLILHHHTKKLFQDGMIIGWRKTFWDRIFFLGPQYLVAFPSGFIFATHMDGLQPVKCA